MWVAFCEPAGLSGRLGLILGWSRSTSSVSKFRVSGKMYILQQSSKCESLLPLKMLRCLTPHFVLHSAWLHISVVHMRGTTLLPHTAAVNKGFTA